MLDVLWIGFPALWGTSLSIQLCPDVRFRGSCCFHDMCKDNFVFVFCFVFYILFTSTGKYNTALKTSDCKLSGYKQNFHVILVLRNDKGGQWLSPRLHESPSQTWQHGPITLFLSKVAVSNVTTTSQPYTSKPKRQLTLFKFQIVYTCLMTFQCLTYFLRYPCVPRSYQLINLYLCSAKAQ